MDPLPCFAEVFGVVVLGADTPSSTAPGGELAQYYDEQQLRHHDFPGRMGRPR